MANRCRCKRQCERLAAAAAGGRRVGLSERRGRDHGLSRVLARRSLPRRPAPEPLGPRARSGCAAGHDACARRRHSVTGAVSGLRQHRPGESNRQAEGRRMATTPRHELWWPGAGLTEPRPPWPNPPDPFPPVEPPVPPPYPEPPVPRPGPADPLPSQRQTPTCCPAGSARPRVGTVGAGQAPTAESDKSRVALKLACSVGHSRHDVASGRGRAPCEEAQPGHADAEQRRRRRGPDRRTSGIEPEPPGSRSP
jgi:hypothetical protein